MPKSRMSNVTKMSFNAIREIKVLAKISEFTQVSHDLGQHVRNR